MSDVNYIFVGGCGRSGTTLVQKLLTAHSKIDGYEEFGFLKDFTNLKSKMRIKWESGLIDSYIRSEFELQDLFRNLINTIFEKNKSSGIFYLSEKSPSNIFAFEELMKIYPKAKFINVIRDGRDVLASHLNVKKRYKKKGKFADFTVKSICNLWKDSISVTQKLEAKDNLYTVRFEQLLKEPEQELKSLMKFLEVEFEEHLLSPNEIENTNNTQVNDIWYTPMMYSQNFNLSNIGKWRNLTFTKRIIINLRMVKKLDELGYSTRSIYRGINCLCESLSIENLKGTWLHRVYLKIRLFLS